MHCGVHHSDAHTQTLTRAQQAGKLNAISAAAEGSTAVRGDCLAPTQHNVLHHPRQGSWLPALVAFWQPADTASTYEQDDLVNKHEHSGHSFYFTWRGKDLGVRDIRAVPGPNGKHV